MNQATALKGAVADARPLHNSDFRRLWVTQIITMIARSSVQLVNVLEVVAAGAVTEQAERNMARHLRAQIEPASADPV